MFHSYNPIPAPRKRNMTKVYVSLLFVIIFAVIFIVSIVPLINLNSNSSNSPQPTNSPLFTVTLSPASQTVVSELNQNARFNVTITGNPTYPCAVTLETGQFYQKTTTVSIPSVGGYDWVGPTMTLGNSNTFPIYISYSTPTVYVTVIDSKGNSCNSNSVSVTTK